MSQPVVIFTNLFTLENKFVNQNKYVEMYYVWLNNILKYAKLGENDYCITLTDEVTFNYMKESPIFSFLISNIKQCKIITYIQPKTIKEGMMQRYNIDQILQIINETENNTPYYLYLDIDVLVMNDIHKLFREDIHMNKTSIYLRTEGTDFLSGLYYGELASDDDKNILKTRNIMIPGFSSGIFAWNNSKNINEYFKYIKNMADQTDKDLYTIDQPFFNAAIFNYFFKEQGTFTFHIFSKEHIVENMYVKKENKSDIVLVNYCGIPGDDKFHWDKILMQLILQNL